MSNPPVELIREFKMGSVTLRDPDPRMTPEEVRDAFSVNYPHLSQCDIDGPVMGKDDRLTYTFQPPPVKTKG
jgi:PRTRC genetic system protein C